MNLLTKNKTQITLLFVVGLPLLFIANYYTNTVLFVYVWLIFLFIFSTTKEKRAELKDKLKKDIFGGNNEQ